MAENQLSTGQVLENTVASQLKPLGDLQYFQKKSGQKIDFIFKGDTAVEVKEMPLLQDYNSLGQRATRIGMEKYLLAGRSPAQNGYDDFIWAHHSFSDNHLNLSQYFL